jgi:hypothetical protein
MAKQTKHFIALGDMKAAVLECKQCSSSLTFSFGSEHTHIPPSCPNCGGDWDQSMSSGGFNRVIEQFIAFQRRLKISFDGQNAAALGYTMSVEVDIEEPAAPLARRISSPE